MIIYDSKILLRIDYLLLLQLVSSQTKAKITGWNHLFKSLDLPFVLCT